ncbi:MAG: sugar ABC transporter ATP-binding protein, partial [Rhizobiales bacterium]|nr:sugar ABC transporter ATP-binding protein [Hyphomicrobiales bacterium]
MDSPSALDPPAEAAGPSAPLLVECVGLRKTFGGVVALNDADFNAIAGEVHALVGENGAVKSTLIKAIGVRIRPDAGTIRIKGQAQALGAPEDGHALGIRTVFQELTLLGGMTVAKNLLIGREPRGR